MPAVTGAERVRCHRERRERGILCVVPVEVSEQLVRRLINEGWLEGQDQSGSVRVSRKEIGEALNEMLADWADG